MKKGVSKTVWAIALIIVVIVIAAVALMVQKPVKPAQPAQNVTAPSKPQNVTAPSPTALDTLIIAMDTSDAVSLDPARAYEFASCLVTNQLYDKLVDFELPDLVHVKPEVAESWEVSPDNRIYTFHIRKGIKFASGNELNADAVVYSLQRVIKLKQTAAWVLTQFVSKPEQIEKVDNYTVRITLDRPVAPSFFLATLTFTTGAIVDPKVVEAHAKGGDMGSDWMTDHSAGSGPYILESWERESQIVLVANPNYWKGAPPLKKIIIKHVPEPTDQLLLIKKGDVDIAWDLQADQIAQLAGTSGIVIEKVEGLRLIYIGINVAVKPLDNVKVRQAIRYSIDYDSIVNDILKGMAIKWQTIIPKGLLGADPNTPYYKNITMAKKLLAEAGYPNGFEIELTTPPTYPQIDIATKIQSDLAEAGIKVKIVQMTQSEMYEKYRKQGLQLVLGGWGTDYPDPDDNAEAFGNYRIKQLAWRNSWYDDYAANLTEKAALETNLDKRDAMYRNLSEYILENGPFVILYQQVHPYVLRDWVKGFVPDPTFFYLDFSKIYKKVSS
jgi:peptide/nickel transport system substrate-binding protein